jgi:hypothetical protein
VNQAQLRGLVKQCEANSVYSDAARICEENFETSVTKARGDVAAALQKEAVASKQSQSEGSAKAGYDKAVATLKSLASQGKGLASEVEAYENEVVLPEDFEGIAGTGFDPNVFLDNNSCYRSTQNLLKTYSALLASRAKELELTAQIAAALSARALKGEQGLDFNSLLPALQGPGQGSATGAPPAKKTGQGASDITGTNQKTDR